MWGWVIFRRAMLWRRMALLWQMFLLGNSEWAILGNYEEWDTSPFGKSSWASTSPLRIHVFSHWNKKGPGFYWQTHQAIDWWKQNCENPYQLLRPDPRFWPYPMGSRFFKVVFFMFWVQIQIPLKKLPTETTFLFKIFSWEHCQKCKKLQKMG